MRLRRPQEFRRVWNEGRSWAHPLFVLWLAPAPDAAAPRVGIVASRKLGKAVQRNRARRLLREAVRRLYPQLAGGYDIVLVARAAILEHREPEVRAALQEVCSRAGVWSPKS